MKHYLLALMIACLFASCKTSSNLTQVNEKVLDSILLAQDYQFVPTMALPIQMKNISLDHSFYLKVTPEKIDSYLPFFGRAYSASMNPTEGGIQFVSKDFTYEMKEGKPSEYEIIITTKDTPRRTKFYISTSNAGYTNVRVLEDNRQGISFNGKIELNTKD